MDNIAYIDKGGSFAFMTYGPRWRHLRRIGKKKKR